MKRFLLFGFAVSLATIFFFSCQKELSQESNLNNAVFSFHNDTSKACFPVVISGTYYNGVSAARDTNYIKVVVNVTSTGNYKISTDSIYGFYFSDSNFFSKTGLDTLILKAHGTPILVQNDHLSFPSDSLGSCGFDINVQDSTGTGLGGVVDTTGNGGGGGSTVSGSYSASYVDPNPASDGTWHFTDSTNNKTYSGTSSPATFLTVATINQLSIGGYSTSITNTIFGIGISMPTLTIKTGPYPLNGTTASFSYSGDLQSGITDYICIGSTVNEAIDSSFVNITSYDVSSKRIKGSFRGWAADKNGNPALVKGSFNAIVN